MFALGKHSHATMLRFYFRLVVIPFLLFTTVLQLIHARPYDDHELRDVLLPEGCPAPCFIGIRPGVTTMDEAVKLLRGNEWVGEIHRRVINDVSGFITWTWGDQKPSWISQRAIGQVFITGKKVHAITIATEFVLGETRLTLGLPDVEFVSVPQDTSDQFILYAAFYYQYGLITRSWHPCGVVEPLRKTVDITIIESTDDCSRYVNSFNDLFHAC